MFPVSIEGKICGGRSAAPTAAELKEKIALDLKHQGIEPHIGEEIVEFKNYSIFQWSFRRYAALGAARFRIISHRNIICIEYTLDTKLLFAIATTFAAIIFIVLYPSQNMSVHEKTFIVSMIYVWIFGVNYIAVLVRTRRFLRRLLKT